MRWSKNTLVVIVAAALAIVASCPSSGVARELAGVTLPETTELGGRQLVLNGMGLRRATFLNIEVYAAGLYVATPSHDPAKIIGSKEPKRIVLTFLRDVDHDKIANAIADGFRGSPGAAETLGPRLDQLLRWLPNLKKGNVVAFSYVPGKGTEVKVNDTVRGTLPGEDFASALWGVWLGNAPPDKNLKAKLLGVH